MHDYLYKFQLYNNLYDHYYGDRDNDGTDDDNSGDNDDCAGEYSSD